MDAGRFTEKAISVLSEARVLAQIQGSSTLSPLHLCIALFEDSGGLLNSVLKSCGVQDPSTVESDVREKAKKLPSQDPPPTNIGLDPMCVKVFNQAEIYKKKEKSAQVTLDHLIRGMFVVPAISEIFKRHGVSESKVFGVLDKKSSSGLSSDMRETGGEALDNYTIDLISLAEKGSLDPCIGRDDEIRNLIFILSKKMKRNPVLVGDPGVGKTAIVEGLAQRIVERDVPQSLLNCRVVALDMGLIMGGSKYRGELEQRVKAVIKEATSNENTILFIDEIHTVIASRSQESGAVNISDLLKPALSRGEIRVIGATTPGEYLRYIEKDPAFERRFRKISIGEPSVAATVSILRGLKERYEKFHGIKILDQALVSASYLSDRYISDRLLPDKAIDLVDEACSSIRVQLDSRPEIIDVMERKVVQLEVESIALSRETDPASIARLRNVKSEIESLKEKLEPLRKRHEGTTARLHKIRFLKNKIDNIRRKAAEAERRGDLDVAADLRYYAEPEERAKLDQLQSERCSEENTDYGAPLVSEVVSPEQIMELVSKWTGIPVSKITKSEATRMLEMPEYIRKRVVGQDEAVNLVCEAIIRNRSGVVFHKGVIGSFLFLGPTGVGKTELAKALASVLFDDDKKGIIRIDMSEYMSSHDVSRLIGAPPGYVGYEEGGQLTEAVRRHPYSIILLDEVEKAHPQILSILLQILEDGRLTDGKSRTTNFKNTVVIMTSNLGADILLGATEGIRNMHSGASQSELEELLTAACQNAKPAVMSVVKKHFKPELLNRITNVITFRPLGFETLGKICTLLLGEMAKVLEENHKISLDWTDRAVQALQCMGWDPTYGARPLRRSVESIIGTGISRTILQGSVSTGGILLVDADENSEITIKVKFQGDVEMMPEHKNQTVEGEAMMMK